MPKRRGKVRSAVRSILNYLETAFWLQAFASIAASMCIWLYCLNNKIPYIDSNQAADLGRELTALAILVFGFEFVHSRHLKSSAEKRQVRAVQELIFLVDSTKPTNLTRPKSSRFNIAVDSTINSIDLASRELSIEHLETLFNKSKEFKSSTELAPLRNEELFINLSETFDGLQDLVIESQEKQSEFHDQLLKLYHEIQMLSFLSSRYVTLNQSEGDFKNEADRIINLLNVLSGVVFSLDRLVESRKNLGQSLGKKENYEISHAVSARLFHAIFNCSQKLGVEPTKITESIKSYSKADEIAGEPTGTKNNVILSEKRLEFYRKLIRSIIEEKPAPAQPIPLKEVI